MARNLIPGDEALRWIKPGATRKRISDGEGLYLLLFVKEGRMVGASTAAMLAAG